MHNPIHILLLATGPNIYDRPDICHLPNIQSFKGYNPLVVVSPLLFQVFDETGDFPVELHHHPESQKTKGELQALKSPKAQQTSMFTINTFDNNKVG